MILRPYVDIRKYSFETNIHFEAHLSKMRKKSIVYFVTFSVVKIEGCLKTSKHYGSHSLTGWLVGRILVIHAITLLYCFRFFI